MITIIDPICSSNDFTDYNGDKYQIRNLHNYGDGDHNYDAISFY